MHNWNKTRFKLRNQSIAFLPPTTKIEWFSHKSIWKLHLIRYSNGHSSQLDFGLIWINHVRLSMLHSVCSLYNPIVSPWQIHNLHFCSSPRCDMFEFSFCRPQQTHTVVLTAELNNIVVDVSNSCRFQVNIRGISLYFFFWSLFQCILIFLVQRKRICHQQFS